MIKLLSNASPNGIKVVIMLEELGVPYEHVWIDQYADEQFSAAFVAINPNSKVPAIVDTGADGLAVFESGAILLYLSEKHGQFMPLVEPERSTALSWLMVQMSGVGPTLGNYNHFARPDYSTERIPYAQNRFGNEARRLLRVLDTRLGQVPYFAGPEYSIVDMAMYPWMCLLDFIGLPHAHLSNLRQWCATVGARPAVKRALDAWEAARIRNDAARGAATPQQLDRYFGRELRFT